MSFCRERSWKTYPLERTIDVYCCDVAHLVPMLDFKLMTPRITEEPLLHCPRCVCGFDGKSTFAALFAYLARSPPRENKEGQAIQ